jgi:hypothetical protein
MTKGNCLVFMSKLPTNKPNVLTFHLSMLLA